MTDDVSGPGVAGNYLAWFGTDDGFFLNNGVQPFASDQALQMEVLDAVPEPSTWAMMLVGFAGLGFAGYRRQESAPAFGPRAVCELSELSSRGAIRLESARHSTGLWIDGSDPGNFGRSTAPGLLRHAVQKDGVFRRPIAHNDDRGSSQVQLALASENSAFTRSR